MSRRPSLFYSPARLSWPEHSRRAALFALALDAWGEPPARMHPVVWMGRFLKAARQRWRATTPAGRRAEGGAWWTLGAVFAAGTAWLAEGLAQGLAQGWAQRTTGRSRPGSSGSWAVRGALLKPLLARRALFGAVGEVHDALVAGDLPEARRKLGWHLVSRETADLSTSEVAGAAIESLAENLSDSVIAPLLHFRVGGLPLAALYRYANTADAMWGYHTPELTNAGRVAARADDLLNLAPARLTALCTVLAARLACLDARAAWRVWRRDARRTPSPNAGHPMSAFAGALGIRLDKRGVYRLGAGGRAPDVADLPRALRLARWTLALAVLALLLPGHRGRRE